jgi:hypothetical protein
VQGEEAIAGYLQNLSKEAMELLQTPEAENIERCEIIAAQLKEKVTLLTISKSTRKF